MKQIALLGSTASGKTNLSIKIAKQTNSVILSLDSLSIYREIDIASAKPSMDERCKIEHFGIDEIYINEHFDVINFFELYKKAKSYAKENEKNLIVVGGTSFYLKSMLVGLSFKRKLSNENKIRLEVFLENLENAYHFIKINDLEYSQKISSNDKYRIEKWFEIYLQSGEIPTIYFQKNRQKPLINSIKIYQIDIDREKLRKKIRQRTLLMIEKGLIKEVKFLLDKYTKTPNPMKSIGIKETVEYLEGYFDKDELINQISNHTAQLAKRQRTFNKSQFENVELFRDDEEIYKKACEFLL